MSTHTDSKIVARVQKLLALGEDQAGLPEGLAAMQLARRLMREHQIAQAELPVVELPDSDSDPLVSDTYTLAKRTLWRARLLWIVATHLGVYTVRIRGTRELHLFGRQSRVELVPYLYEVAERQILAEAAAWVERQRSRGVWDHLPAGEKRSEQNNFRQSAVDGFHASLPGLHEDSEELTRQLLCEAHDRAHASFSNIARGQARWGYSEDGYRAGKRVSIQKGVRGRRSAPRRLKSS